MALYPKISFKGHCMQQQKKNQRTLYIKISFKGHCIQHFLLKGIAYKKLFDRVMHAKFSLTGCCMQKFLWKGAVYNMNGSLYTKFSLKWRWTFVHFHAVCHDILHVENHALSKKYFYAKLGSKKVRNFLQVCLVLTLWPKAPTWTVCLCEGQAFQLIRYNTDCIQSATPPHQPQTFILVPGHLFCFVYTDLRRVVE